MTRGKPSAIKGLPWFKGDTVIHRPSGWTGVIEESRGPWMTSDQRYLVKWDLNRGSLWVSRKELQLYRLDLVF
jgi:hypothetical protein